MYWIYVIESLKRNVGCNKLLGQSSKVSREGTIFYLFFPFSLYPLPYVDCKTVTLFLRIKVGRASSKKKKRSDLEPGSRRARLRRKAKTMLNRFWEKPTQLVCILCPMQYKTKVFVRIWSFGLDFVFYTTTWEISAIWLA